MMPESGAEQSPYVEAAGELLKEERAGLRGKLEKIKTSQGLLSAVSLTSTVLFALNAVDMNVFDNPGGLAGIGAGAIMAGAAVGKLFSFRSEKKAKERLHKIENALRR